MASRRNIPPTYDEHYLHPSEMIRRGPLLSAHRPVDPPHPSFILENKLASQKEEIERLAGDNHKLASFHLAMKQDLIAAQREAEKLRDHIRSIQTEGDIQIRILLEKIAKLEDEIRAGHGIKKELEEAHLEARNLVEARAELTAKIEQSSQQLEKTHADVKKIPEMYGELVSLREQHQRLRETFDYEKSVNTKKVSQMYVLEKEMIAVYEEVERLRPEVLKAEKRANAPPPPQIPPPPPPPPPPLPPAQDPASAPMHYGGPYMNSTNFYPDPYYVNGGYVDSYGRPLQMFNGPGPEIMNPYPSAGYAVGPHIINGPPVNNVGGVGGVNPAWGRVYDMNHTQM